MTNIYGLKRGSGVRIVDLIDGSTIAVPVALRFANGRVLDAHENGSCTVHWIGNYNTSGDFRTELMRFDTLLTLRKEDTKARNIIRKRNGLVPVQH